MFSGTNKLIDKLCYRTAGLLFGAGLMLGPIGAQAVGLVECDEAGCTLLNLFELLVRIYDLLMGMAALVAMLFLVYGGAQMLYWSFMENSATELENAKYTVRRALGGFGIIILAYLIVNTVIVMMGGEGLNDIFGKLF